MSVIVAFSSTKGLSKIEYPFLQRALGQPHGDAVLAILAVTVLVVFLV